MHQIGIDYEGDPNNELQTAISDTFHLRIELDRELICQS